jgi:hypothetical protein
VVSRHQCVWGEGNTLGLLLSLRVWCASVSACRCAELSLPPQPASLRALASRVKHEVLVTVQTQRASSQRTAHARCSLEALPSGAPSWKALHCASEKQQEKKLSAGP